MSITFSRRCQILAIVFVILLGISMILSFNFYQRSKIEGQAITDLWSIYHDFSLINPKEILIQPTPISLALYDLQNNKAEFVYRGKVGENIINSGFVGKKIWFKKQADDKTLYLVDPDTKLVETFPLPEDQQIFERLYNNQKSQGILVLATFSREDDDWEDKTKKTFFNLFDANKGLFELIYEGAVGSPVWSPDGQRIAFTRAVKNLEDYVLDLFIYDLATKKTIPLNLLNLSEVIGWLDNERIVYEDANFDVQVFNLKSQTSRMIFPNPQGSGRYRISFDGKLLFYNRSIYQLATGKQYYNKNFTDLCNFTLDSSYIVCEDYNSRVIRYWLASTL